MSFADSNSDVFLVHMDAYVFLHFLELSLVISEGAWCKHRSADRDVMELEPSDFEAAM